LPTQDRQELKVANGGMEVHLTLVPMSKETGGHVVPSLAELEMWIREQGIKSELDLAAIKTAIDRAKEGLTAEAIASRGRPPRQGQDGYIEYLMDYGNAVAPKLSDAGTVDLRASLIRNVKPGDPLAIIHSPTAGEPGLDIWGKWVPATAGKALEPRLGANTQKSPNDLNLVIAQTAGHVRLVEGVLEVQEFYLVPGDIDYGTGNIAFEKSVLIQGDVKSGFSVDAGGDLEVTGLVEDCLIKSQGKVRIGGGFTGQGKGLIQARGDVQIGYIRNQHVKSEKTIMVQKEAVNSRLQARQSITVSGLLAGGRVQARYAIECQVAGTETGTPTQIEAGYDFTINEEKVSLRVEMDRMGKYAKKLADSIRQIHNMEKLNRGLEPWSIELMFEIEGGRSKVEAKINALRERFALLDAQASNPERATVTVHRKAFSGVVIKIGKDMFLIDEPLQGPKTFYAKDGVIQVR
jgi:uncharacterized protein